MCIGHASNIKRNTYEKIATAHPCIVAASNQQQSATCNFGQDVFRLTWLYILKFYYFTTVVSVLKSSEQWKSYSVNST